VSHDQYEAHSNANKPCTLKNHSALKYYIWTKHQHRKTVKLLEKHDRNKSTHCIQIETIMITMHVNEFRVELL